MKNSSFEDYWLHNQDTYIEQARTKAQEDFNRLSSKFKASVSINDDGCFVLNIAHNFSIYGDKPEELVKQIIDTLNQADIVSYNTNTICFGSGETAKNNIEKHWKEMKEFVITNLNYGKKSIFVETAEIDLMSVEISENN